MVLWPCLPWKNQHLDATYLSSNSPFLKGLTSIKLVDGFKLIVNGVVGASTLCCTSF